MLLTNRTHLQTAKLKTMMLDAIAGWPHDELKTAVRYSRGADFSGSCYYDASAIYVNLGRHNPYPYTLHTHIARPKSNQTHWWRELYHLEINRPEELVLFIFLHEFYHLLVRRAGRNVRQKEGRCDRFATRALVDDYGVVVRDGRGQRVERHRWDFQDLDAFVAAAGKRDPRSARSAAQHPPRLSARDNRTDPPPDPQMRLF